MLSKILSKESCASCRFCCVFRRTSLWETPVFTEENIRAIEKRPELDASVLERFEEENRTYARYDLSEGYSTDDPEEEVPCPYLSDKGCILNSVEKPWDCKIWPLRVMRKTGGELVIALTPTCPEVNKLELERVRSFTEEELADELFEYARNHPYLIKEYRENFPVLTTEKPGTKKKNG